ncbi:MAG: RagB/SusD family nutrient uptake outer membrane protein [Odoribacter sp.]
MKKKLYRFKWMFLMCLTSIVVTSCSDWLDVKPKTEEEAESLFSTEEGFKSALSGVYIALCQPNLYGRELTYGMVGVLGQEWKSGSSLDNSSSAYAKLIKYSDLDKSTVKPMIDAVWNDSYRTIANVNTLIEYTDLKRDVLLGNNYEIIRGEALALRAFIHFDLLRLYAPYNFTEAAKVSIPYVKEPRPVVTPQSKPFKVIEYILEDLNAALELLKKDPIYTGQDVTGLDNGYLANRNFHLNYYAVCGLKARVCLYAGKMDAALVAAKEVIASQNDKGLFAWVNPDDLTTTYNNLRDRTFSSEHLFAFNATKLEEYIKSYFRETTSPLKSRVALTEVDDYRNYLYQDNGGAAKVFSKFWQLESQYVPGQGLVRPKRDRVPAIRISEMYYIAAECLKMTNATEALALLNKVRAHRGLVNLTNTDPIAVQKAILDEYNQDLLGEGQIYFYHKRMGTKKIAKANAVYVLAMPDDEIDLGQRD